MNPQDRKLLLHDLKWLSTILAMPGLRTPSTSCIEANVPDDSYRILEENRSYLYSTWPNFSGNEYYPIPAPKGKRYIITDDYDGDEELDPHEGYWTFTNNHWTGRCGKLNRELLEHMIRILKSS